jgi:LysM repeat protein
MPVPTPTLLPAGLGRGDEIQYFVLRGDTLAAIAAEFYSTEDAIIEANDLADSNSIFVGQLLIVPVNLITPTPGPSPTLQGSQTANQFFSTEVTQSIIPDLDPVGVGYRDSTNIFITVDLPNQIEDLFGVVNETRFECLFSDSQANRLYCFGRINAYPGTDLFLRLFRSEEQAPVFEIPFSMPTIETFEKVEVTASPANNACTKWRIRIGNYIFTINANNQRTAEDQAVSQCLALGASSSSCYVSAISCISQ